MSTQTGDASRSAFIHSTMNPTICEDTGCDTKMNFLTGSWLCGDLISNFVVSANPTLSNLVIALMEIVANRYPPFNNVTSKNRGVYPPVGLMQDHRMVINEFDKALSLPWPDGDKAEPCLITRRSSTVWASCSGSKRSRITEQTDGDQRPSKRQA